MNVYHLEILHYYQVVRSEDGEVSNNSALHTAYHAGNQRSIDIVLNFMSKINFNASRNFNDIMPEMLDMNYFPDYFKCLPV